MLKENNLVDAINWNEDMLVKLNGSINNLTAFEREKIHFITQSYRSMKTEITNDLYRKYSEDIKELF